MISNGNPSNVIDWDRDDVTTYYYTYYAQALIDDVWNVYSVQTGRKAIKTELWLVGTVGITPVEKVYVWYPVTLILCTLCQKGEKSVV